jgi:DNA-binding LacI/PurR family transcriptional regulator
MTVTDTLETRTAPGRRPTHRDIARLAGTSQATVSFVLNNQDTKIGISRATRQAVLAVAKQLGYTADLGARRHRESGAAAPELTLALLRPSGTPLGLGLRLVDAAAAALASHSPTSQLVIEEYHPGRLFEHPGLLVASRFHGAVLTSLTPADEVFLAETALPVPVVAFQRQVPGHAWVDVDNVAGGATATRHLLARGRRRITAIAWSAVPSRAVQQRLQGYRQALAEAGLAGAEHVVWAGEIGEAGGSAAGTEALETGNPDAILVLSDVMALGVLHAIHRAGRRVPEDVAVVGYDDLSFAAFLEPPLTTTRLPYDDMGRAAVTWLVDAARGRAGGLLHAVYQPELVVRGSA